MVNASEERGNGIFVTPTKQRTTRYPDEPHLTYPPPQLPSLLGAALAALLWAGPASAQVPPGSMGNRASGAWQMPNASPAPASAPPVPSPAPPPTPATYGGFSGYGSTAYVPPPSPPVYGPSTDAPPDRPEDVEGDEPSPPFFDVALSTQVPLSLGVLASLELPARLLLQLEAGWMPPGYGAAINGMVQAFAGYDDAIGGLIDQSFGNAAVVRAAGGWRPFPSVGFEIFGGYTYVGLSGSVAPEDVARVVGGEFASQVAQQLLTEDVDIASQLHNVHVGLGWRWVAFDHLVIRTNISYMQTLASSTTVETPENPAAGETATPIANRVLGDAYETYVKMPVVGLSAGYRF